jgi:hypothetical protein
MNKILLQILFDHFGAFQGCPLLLTHCAAHFAETRSECLRLQDGRRRLGGVLLFVEKVAGQRKILWNFSAQCWNGCFPMIFGAFENFSGAAANLP